MNKGLSIKKRQIPKILLIGAGQFGRNHLRVLKDLSEEGLIDLVGVFLRNETTRKSIEIEFGVKTFELLTPELLMSVDAVDVVTPVETHFEIVKKCLKYTNVFVEKPLATNEKHSIQLDKIAKHYKRILVVGHIFRYHPVSEKLKEIIREDGLPSKIYGAFINPKSTYRGHEPSIELLHLFDVVNFIWNRKPETVHATRTEDFISVVDVRYTKFSNAQFILGWQGESKKRTITFVYPKITVEANFIEGTILVFGQKKSKVYTCPIKIEPLKRELINFAAAITGQNKKYVSAKVASDVVSVAEKAIPKTKDVPRVAVIGGGIFGTSIAAELGKFCSVSVFERNPELMMEGSFINQFRHHYGYHYPRSDDTVEEVQKSRDDFEKIFSKALVRKTPTYYGLSKKGSQVTPREFVYFCKKHNLPYKNSHPLSKFLNKKELSFCVKVPEPSYNYKKLKDITKKRLGLMPNVQIHFNTEVDNVRFKIDGTKIVSYVKTDHSGKKTKAEEEFDFVINATYANINRFSKWLDFENFIIRVDRAEVLILKLKIPPVSLTVIDGQFPTLMPTGNRNEFTLYHARESIIDRYVPKDGLIKKVLKIKSNKDSIIRESQRFFPTIKEAKFVESRIVHRAVIAHREYDDIRVANIIEHGFGCWSVLSGKILTSVSVGLRFSDIIKKSSRKLDGVK